MKNTFIYYYLVENFKNFNKVTTIKTLEIILKLCIMEVKILRLSKSFSKIKSTDKNESVVPKI